MQRCIDIAKNGLGSTYPNPMVGSVIVHNDKIIGEGYTSAYGGPHAEVNAISSVKNPALLKDATIYVSLEPCSHFGKTPPCSDLIIEKEIKNVVIGIIDPFDKVAGRGVTKLKAAGCQVTVGVLEKECRESNKRFLTFHDKKRPYIILKWAESADGFIAPPAETRKSKEPVWITNPYSRQLVHQWRSEETAILVGTNTVLADNPSLTTRDWHGPSPVRIALDKHHRIHAEHAITNGNTKTILLRSDAANHSLGNNVIVEVINFEKDVPQQIVDVLYRHQLQSLIVEGGAITLQSFINAGLWDEARIFTGTPTLQEGIQAPKISGKPIAQQTIINDTLTLLKKS